MGKKRALLMVRVEAPPSKEAEWNEWYNNRHIADRLVIPGFLFARRFVAVDGQPKYLALYDLADVSVLESPGYLKLRDWEKVQPADTFWGLTSKLPDFSRGLYEQVYPEEGDYQPPKSEFVLVLGHDVPANREEEFNAWYNTDHIAALQRVPGCMAVRRFVANGPAPSKYLTVYDLASDKVLESPEWLKGRESPWGNWVRTWSVRKLRGIYRQIFPKP